MAVGTLVALWWIVVTVGWYALLTSFAFLWIGWLIYRGDAVSGTARRSLRRLPGRP